MSPSKLFGGFQALERTARLFGMARSATSSDPISVAGLLAPCAEVRNVRTIRNLGTMRVQAGPKSR
eukprot:11085245-Alexandrium_andersonii.AAC.1